MPEREYLLFQLYGPLASWGDIAVGEYRPSYERPSKSAVLGLLAGALGVKRPNTLGDVSERQQVEAIHQRMAQDYGFAVEVTALRQIHGDEEYRPFPVLGRLLRDYHTVQRPPVALIKKAKHPVTTRRDELRFPRDELATTLSTRDYREDAYARVALWAKTDSSLFSLDRLKFALESPVFTPYLGRKACTPSLPFDAHVLLASGWNEAFDKAAFKSLRGFGLSPAAAGEGGEIARLRYGETREGAALQRLTRRDEPASRLRWQFAERTEYQRIIR